MRAQLIPAQSEAEGNRAMLLELAFLSLSYHVTKNEASPRRARTSVVSMVLSYSETDPSSMKASCNRSCASSLRFSVLQ
eukprot:5049638-Amphidinium_carterae.2